MKNPELYQKTIKILSEAYLKGTLVSGTCVACACGNLVAAANNCEIVRIQNEFFWKNKDKEYLKPSWSQVIGTLLKPAIKTSFLSFKTKYVPEQYICVENFAGNPKKEILSTGYELEEFAMIESSFEFGYIGSDPMYNALINVVNTLDVIHQNTDTEITKQSTKTFTKKAILQD